MSRAIPHTLRDIMTRDVCTVNENDSLAFLLEAMKLFRFRHTPVTDGENVVGVLTERDLVRVSASSLLPAAHEQNTLLLNTFKVCDVMSREVVAGRPDMTIREAGKLLFARRLGCR